ncbi:MAG: class I SAM-dependent methyltransferase [Acidimicrobiales bacterium]
MPAPTTNASPESASSRWKRELEAWAIPEAILEAAPASPWGFPTAMFAKATDAVLRAEPTPSREVALEALGAGGSVLDVGVGGGAASLPLAPPAGLLVAVDEAKAMLETFAEAARMRGARHELIAGRWPEVSATTPVTDVVVCHHVAYNVADLAAFLQALTDHARRRVVLELTARHPLSALAPLWASIHGIERPSTPTSSQAAAVATELGYDVGMRSFERPALWDAAGHDDRVAFARRQLCVGPEHDDEIAAHFEAAGAAPSRELTTLWWDLPVR